MTTLAHVAGTFERAIAGFPAGTRDVPAHEAAHHNWTPGRPAPGGTYGGGWRYQVVAAGSRSERLVFVPPQPIDAALLPALASPAPSSAIASSPSAELPGWLLGAIVAALLTWWLRS